MCTPPDTIGPAKSTPARSFPIATSAAATTAGPRPTERAALDIAVAELQTRRSDWVAVSPRERLLLVDELRRDIAAVADRWAAAVAEAEGLGVHETAEVALAGPYLTLRQLRLMGVSLRGIVRDGVPRIPGGVRTLPDGRVSARVMPFDRFDRIMYRGVSADVWMQPGVTAEELPLTQAVAYRQADAGGVCLVLGGGNVSSIAPLDAIYKLFVANRVVLLKVHPTQAFLTPILEAGMSALVRRGFLRIVHGGAIEGTYLAGHLGIDELHVTGSSETYNAIVFGSGAEGEERRRRDEPILDKPFSAELGNLTPVIVVPGRWSDAEIGYQADNVASMLTNNAGFNCTTPRVIITPAGWRLRQRPIGRVPPAGAGRLHEDLARDEEVIGASDRAFGLTLAAVCGLVGAVRTAAVVGGDRPADRGEHSLRAGQLVPPGSQGDQCGVEVGPERGQPLVRGAVGVLDLQHAGVRVQPAGELVE